MYIELIILFLMIASLFVSYKYFKDVLHPSFILSFVYTIVMLFYVIMKLITGSKYTINAYGLYFPLGLFVFFIGTLLGGKFKKFSNFTFDFKNKKSMTLINRIFVICQLIIVILFVLDVYFNSKISDKNIISLLNASKMNLYSERYLFMLARTISYVFSLYAIYLLLTKQYLKENFAFYILQILVTLIHVVFHSSRTVWFMFLIPVSILVLLINYKNTKSIVRMSIFVFVFIVLTTLIVTVIRGQSTSLEILRCYLDSGIVQFTEWAKLDEPLLYGKYTFRMFLKILSKLKLYSGDFYWVDQRYLSIPNLDWNWSIGNVFSFYHGYAQDFGLVYAMFIQFLVGMFHGFIYYKLRETKLDFWVLTFCFFCNPLILQFFSDQYASNLSLWIQIEFFVLLISKTNIFYEYSKN